MTISQVPTSLTIFYIQKSTTNAKISQKMSLKVCGYESVQILKQELIIESFINKGDQVIQMTELFNILDPECPIKYVSIK